MVINQMVKMKTASSFRGKGVLVLCVVIAMIILDMGMMYKEKTSTTILPHLGYKVIGQVFTGDMKDNAPSFTLDTCEDQSMTAYNSKALYENTVVLNISADFHCTLREFNRIVGGIRHQELQNKAFDKMSFQAKAVKQAFEHYKYNQTHVYFNTISQFPHVKTVTLVWQTLIQQKWNETGLPVGYGSQMLTSF